MTTHHRFPLAVAICASALIARSSAIAVSTSGLDTDGADGYDVGVQVSEAGGGATWTYTITKTTRRREGPRSLHPQLRYVRRPESHASPASSPPPSTAWTGWTSSRRPKVQTGCGVDVDQLREVRRPSRSRHARHRVHARRRLPADGFDGLAEERDGRARRQPLLGPGLQGLSPHVDDGGGSVARRQAVLGHQHLHEAVRLRLHGASELHGRLWRAHRRRSRRRRRRSVSESTRLPLRHPHRSGHRRRSLQLQHRGPPAQRDEVDHQQLDVGEGPGQLGRVADPGMEVQAAGRAPANRRTSFTSTS